MHRIVPEIIIENYRAGRYQGSFKAASLFLDISGFSAMTDALMGHGRHGAEVLAAMMRSVFDPLVQAIFGQGGMIVGYAGDSVTALYLINDDESSAVQRALASAYFIQEELKARPYRDTPYGTFRISAKIGLALGSTSWGILRSRNGERATYYFRGDAIDQVAEAEHHASAGDIILASKIRERFGNDITTEPVGAFHKLGEVSGKLPAPQPINLPPIDPIIASLFAPQEVITQDLQAEFRQSVHLFMQIPDLDDEQLKQFMYEFFEFGERYGGMIERIDFGDKGCNMIVLWGAPVAYENDIDRALNFILDLRASVDIPITVGITYYVALAGYIGGRLHQTYTCYGWGINLAARFMMRAEQNDVWLDERIMKRIQKRFNFDFADELTFKGFARPQKVYILRGRKSEADIFFQGTMVGREKEFQQLTDFVAPLWSNTYAGLMGVLGEAGMGKSRLVYEFWRSPLFQEHHSLWALCQADQVLRHSFNPFRYWLTRYFEIVPGQDEATRLLMFSDKLDELIASTKDTSLTEELERTRSFLAALVDLQMPNSLYEQLDAQARYDNTIIALISLIKAESLRQPLILFMEDSQYLDADSLDFLPRLKRALVADAISYPIAIVATARLEGENNLQADEMFDREIRLEGLSNEAVSSIADTVLGEAAAPELLEMVAERADGNPFFAEQILRYLREEKLLEPGDTGWRLNSTTQLSVLPVDISAILVARLDQLIREVREVIHAASILGREFEERVLARMLMNEMKVRDEIEEAEKASIWLPLNEIRYIFIHALMRDVAYNMQMQARRQGLHALAFAALEEQYEAELQRHYGELAYHSEQAGLTDQARNYLRKAGDAALETYRNPEAIDYYSRALALTPQDQLQERFDLLLERAEAYNRRGDRESQSRDLDELEALAHDLGSDQAQAEIWIRRAEYFYNTSDYLRSIESTEHVKEIIKGKNEALLVSAYINASLSLLRLGKLEDAMQQATEGLMLARKLGIKLEEGQSLNTMGLIALEQKNPADAQEHLSAAVTIAHDTGDLLLEAKALSNLANLLGLVQGDFRQARDHYEQVYRVFHERGDRYREGMASGNLGWCAGMEGDFKAARAYLEQALSISREVGNLYQETYTLVNLSSVAGIQGDAANALDYAVQAYELSQKIGERSGEAWSQLYLGHAHVLTGEFEKARQAYEASVQIRTELQQPGLATEPMAGLIQVALELDDLTIGLQHTETILAHLINGGTLDGTEEPLRIYLACYSALEKAKDPRAHIILQDAVQLLEAQVSNFRGEEARRMYVNNVPWRLSIHKAWESGQASAD